MKTKKVIAILLALVLGISVLSGCRNQETDHPNASNPDGEKNGQSVEYSSEVLAADGKSEYAIVIAQEAGEYIRFAASELQTLFAEATGAELPIVTDADAVKDGKYISIGSNQVQAQSGVTCDYATYKNSGARLVTNGNGIILTGGSDEGALYAVSDGKIFCGGECVVDAPLTKLPVFERMD